MHLRWDDLQLFLTVYEQGSLSAAARRLRLGQPTLSRRIAELEAVVGEAVFYRQNQGAVLTAVGEKLLPAVQSMAEWANEAEISVQKSTHLPEGKVRIAAPPGIAYELLAPLAAKIHRQHPQIQVELLSGIETLNLGRGEADLSLRSEASTDSDLLCIDKISSPMRVYVSTAYAATLTEAPSLAELDWICWSGPYEWMRTNQELKALIPDFKPSFTSDDYLVQLAACQAGVGAMVLPQALYHYRELCGLQRLCELNIDLGSEVVGSLYLVCHKRHRYLAKIQLVMDFISEEFEALRQRSQ